jgi:hypothetical protein
MSRQGTAEIAANRESVAQVQRVRPRDPAKVAEEVRAYLAEVRARRDRPMYEKASQGQDRVLQGQIELRHRAGGW